MKYIIRILMLPFAIIMWIIYYSYQWVKYGGTLVLNKENHVTPSELLEAMKLLNKNLEDAKLQVLPRL